MRTSLTLCAVGLLLALSSCGSEAFTPEGKRADAIDRFNLDPTQIDIMDAYYEGITKDGDEAKFTRRWTQISACYASRIKVKPKYDTVHRDYIRDFAEVEKDYYPWFQRRGIGQTAAYDIGEKARKTSDYCHKAVRR